MSSPAFVPLGVSSFAGASVARPTASVCSGPARAPAAPRRSVATPTAMAKKGKTPFGLPNPFKNKSDERKEDPTGFASPQPGDPGYVPPKVEKFKFEDTGPSGPPSKIKAKAEAEAKAKEEQKKMDKPAPKEADPPSKFQKPSKLKKTSLPVASGTAEVEKKKRGLALLREDFLKSAPERAGVGRQDQTAIMAPVYGEPGYKPKAYEVAYVSDLGISPFPDDANAVGKVGGLKAVEKAARLAKKGKSAAALKVEAMNQADPLNKKKEIVEATYDIPDYLKPIPEDTPRKGLSWKNYNGR